MRSTMLLSTAVATILSASLLFAGYASNEHTLAAISQAELTIERTANAYEAIHTLRPHWLGEDKSESELPAVFIEMRCTETSCLRWLESDQVEEVRYVLADGSQTDWPPANDHGAIVVTLRAPPTVLTLDAGRR